MNDEFLHRLRRRPPARLASRLKARLDLQEPLAKTRLSWLRPFVFAALAGGIVAAATLLNLQGMPGSVARLFEAESSLPKTSPKTEFPAAPSTEPRRPANAKLDRSSRDESAVESAPRNEVRDSAGVSPPRETEQ